MKTMKDINTNLVLDVMIRQHHIDSGRRDSCDACPIALALNDVPSREYTYSLVHKEWIELRYINNDYPGRQLKIDLPERAKQFIRPFDAGMLSHYDMIPFHFKLDLSQGEVG